MPPVDPEADARRETHLLRQKLEAEISELRSKSAHFDAMSLKIARERAYYPYVVGSAVMTAVVAVLKFVSA